MAIEEVTVVEPDLPSTELPDEAGQPAQVVDEAGQPAQVVDEAGQPVEVVEQPKDDQTAVESTEAEAPLKGDEGNPPKGAGGGG